MSKELDKSLQRLITLINIILIFTIIGIVASVGIGLGTAISAKTITKQVQEQVINTTTTNTTNYMNSKYPNYTY